MYMCVDSVCLYPGPTLVKTSTQKLVIITIITFYIIIITSKQQFIFWVHVVCLSAIILKLMEGSEYFMWLAPNQRKKGLNFGKNRERYPKIWNIQRPNVS